MKRLCAALLATGSGMLGVLIPIDVLFLLSSNKYNGPDYPIYAVLSLLTFVGSYGYTKRFLNALMITMYAISFWGSGVTFAFGAMILSGTYRKERFLLVGKVVYSSMEAQLRIGWWFTIIGFILLSAMIVSTVRLIKRAEQNT